MKSSHEVAKVLEFQLQHQSFQRNPRADLLQNGLVVVLKLLFCHLPVSFSAQEAALCGGCTFAGSGIETQEDRADYPEAQSSELSEVIPRWF